MVEFADFLKVDVRVGTILEAKLNPKARKPAYVLQIDFGSLGIKTSSAQITENHSADALLGTQVLAVVNFPAKRVAGVNSEVLVLAVVDEVQGTILVRPAQAATNGSRLL